MVWNKTHTRGTDWVLPRRGTEEKVALEWGQGGQRRLGEESFQTEREEGARKGEDAEGKARVSDADSSQGLE